jgi:FMN phosphatase YigB (HAD superfamily)
MKPRAVIFDIYGTLLEVGSPPADAEVRWEELCRELPGGTSRPGRLEFSIACQQEIARQHAAARARGIRWPEVHWPSVVRVVLPGLGALPPAAQEQFIAGHVQTARTTSLRLATAEALRQLRRQPGVLGIASNAQAYTLRELADALAGHGLGLDLFAPSRDSASPIPMYSRSSPPGWPRAESPRAKRS